MRNQFVIYRANKNNTGHALNLGLYANQDGSTSFHVKIAKQTGKDANDNGVFDWKGACNAKLNAIELGEILSVIRGIKPKVGPDGKGLYHTTDKATTTIAFETMENSPFGNFSLRISRTEKEGGNKFSGLLALSWAEAMVIEELLKFAVLQLAEWGVPEPWKKSTVQRYNEKNDKPAASKVLVKAGVDGEDEPVGEKDTPF
jgi:hypothetical protein